MYTYQNTPSFACGNTLNKVFHADKHFTYDFAGTQIRVDVDQPGYYYVDGTKIDEQNIAFITNGKERFPMLKHECFKFINEMEQLGTNYWIETKN